MVPPEDHMRWEPDEEDLYDHSVENPARPNSRNSRQSSQTPPPRESSPDLVALGDRVMRNSRYSVDGIIDPKRAISIDDDALAALGMKPEDVKDSFDRTKPLGPQMYQLNHIGLYAHYAAVGLSGGIQGLAPNFCYYFFEGENNVCANSASMIFMPWGFKIFYAMITDSFRPFGMRRKPYMLGGWAVVLLITLVQAIFSNHMNAQVWLLLSIASQGFLMLADVPADGYSVEIGQMESEHERGMVLSTGQRIRFGVGIIAGIIQAVLLNGPHTNKKDCPIEADACWSFGLKPNGYYGLLFALLFVLCVPIYYLEEPSSILTPKSTFSHHASDLWETMKNPTTMFLLIFVVGNAALSAMAPITQTYTQYNLIGLTNFQSGIMSVLTNLATMGGIIAFQKWFINWNWRYTQYISVFFSANLGLLWILVYHNIGGTMDPWFTIFLQLNVAMSQGLAQVLFAMAVIELAKKGQESTTYEMVVSTANSAGLLSFILATQMLSVTDANTCKDKVGCPNGQVDLYDVNTYVASNGPNRFTTYTLVIWGINMAAMVIFTRFLPEQKAQCAEWKKAGNTFIDSANPIVAFFTPKRVGITSIAVASSVILYNTISSIMLLNPSTACLPAFGGSGCK